VDVGSAVDVSGVYAVSNTYTPYSLEPWRWKLHLWDIGNTAHIGTIQRLKSRININNESSWKPKINDLPDYTAVSLETGIFKAGLPYHEI
jgi:hypothetical protein